MPLIGVENCGDDIVSRPGFLDCVPVGFLVIFFRELVAAVLIEVFRINVEDKFINERGLISLEIVLDNFPFFE